jgi:MFS superfamily sulfate permease-like transporter
MSYATSLAKLNASTGLFAAAIPGIAYAFLGTCRQLNVGPEAALSLLVGQAVEGILHLDPHSVIDMREAIAVSTIITFQVRGLSAQR